MQATANIYQATRTLDQRSQDVRSTRVHRKHAGMALRGQTAVLLGVNARVVNDSIHSPDRVHLLGNGSDLGAAAEIAEDNSLGTLSSWPGSNMALRHQTGTCAAIADNVPAANMRDHMAR
jgi:hypothetical protein